MAETLQTFRQYAGDHYRKLSAKHGLSLAEIEREVPGSAIWADWRDLSVRAFNNGANVSTSLWRSMDEGLRYRILRTPRALRDDALTRELRAKL